MNELQAPGVVVAVVLGLILLSGNALSLTATRLAATGRMHRGDFGGIRTPATRLSDASWIAAHEAAWPWCLVLNSLGGVSALATMLLGTTVVPFLVAVGCAVVFTAASAVAQLIVGNRAAERADS